MVTGELALNREVNIFKEPMGGDKRRKEVTQLCDSAHVHSAASQTSKCAVVYLITLTG